MNNTLNDASTYYLRNALGEIPSNDAEVPSVNVTPTNAGTPNVLTRIAGTLPRQARNNIPSNLISPSPSPDEMIIKGRGRRSLPVKWSPIPVMSPQKLDRTPVRHSPGKGLIVLRSSPRKRLQLNALSPADLEKSRKLLMSSSPLAKRSCVISTGVDPMSPEAALKDLSQSQLVNVLSAVLLKHPEIRGEVSALISQPDLKSMEEQLHIYKKEIFKALPTSRLSSKTDSRAFCKAVPHLAAFKKSIQDNCSILADSLQWEVLQNYTQTGMSCVRSLPIWDSEAHNNCSQKACFKILAQYCFQSLQKICWKDEDQVSATLKRLEQYKVDHEDMRNCIEYLQQL